MARLKEFYKKDVVPSLMKEYGYKNVMQVPKLEKIVLNVGLGEAVENVKAVAAAVSDIAAITGQKPIVTKAKKAISNFKLRQGAPIGVKVTLRRDKMYEFLDRFINIALPSVRDFKGLSKKGFDSNGNYTLGLKEQLIFAELEYDKIDKIRGMNITIVTTANTDNEGRSLLKGLGIPFRN